MFSLRRKTFDDVLRGVYLHLLKGKGIDEVHSTKGRSLEVFGAQLELTNPRARISRSIQRSKVFSAIGEFFWYISGSKDLKQIEYYIHAYSECSDDKETLNGAYGPRIFGVEASGVSPWSNIISRLSDEKTRGTRNAVIPIATAMDFLIVTKDRPCTCSLQFVVRRGRLHMQAHMRSNDVYFGMPHDFFAFTMLQEIVAREIGAGLGSYIHSVGSLHLYADPRDGMFDHRDAAQNYIDEGLYSYQSMPPMPEAPQMEHIQAALLAEKAIREGDLNFETSESLPGYWKDIITMLRAYGFSKKGEEGKMLGLQGCLDALQHQEFSVYIRDRMQS